MRLELKDQDYAKLFMQNNPIHDNDREKASSIAQNISYNEDVIRNNPLFGKFRLPDHQVYLSKKEMYSIGQFSEKRMRENPYQSLKEIEALLEKWNDKKM